MSIFFVPALLSLFFKLFVLAYALNGKRRVSTVFLSLIIVFAVHNAIEIFGYFFYLDNPGFAMTFIKLYYVATNYLILYIFLHSLSVSKLERHSLTTALITVTTVMSFVVLFTDYVIAGHYSIGYSVTAEKGTYYWLFAAYILIFLVSSFLVIIYGHRHAKSQIDSVRCVQSLLALSPVMLVFILAVMFKMAGVPINATGLAPVATAIFLALVLMTESKHKLSDLRRFLPLSSERQTTHNLMDLLDDYIQSDNRQDAFKELHEKIEKEIILYSLKKCDNNISSTAKMMGLKNRSTLYSMLNRLEMDLQTIKQDTSDQS